MPFVKFSWKSLIVILTLCVLLFFRLGMEMVMDINADWEGIDRN